MLGLHTFVLVLLAAILIFLDQRLHYFRKVQAVTSVIVMPIQYVVNSPVVFFEWLGSSITTQHEVLEENAKLRAQQLLLEAKLQKVIALENENQQLRALLKSSPNVGGDYTIAQLLAVSMDPAVQQVVLDKGSSNGKVYVGQPVLDAYGVMGQVIKAGPFTSRVLLITDVQSAVPVQDSRNGVRAIAMGSGNYSTLQLVNVPNTTDIQKDDLFVTSGLDQRYPQGYPVGVVKSVTRDPELQFSTIVVVPSAHIDRSRQVLLVWPDHSRVTNQTLDNIQLPPSSLTSGIEAASQGASGQAPAPSAPAPAQTPPPPANSQGGQE